MDNTLDRRLLLGAAGLAGIAALSSRAQAGPLNPPAGPVTPGGKTTSEIEPRTPINATNTLGDVDSDFRINAPGSYYLTAPFTVTSGKRGIKIAANGVTIDMNGFTIAGGVAGIVPISNSIQNATIRNGRIIGSETGIAMTQNKGIRLDGMRIEGCIGRGAELGTGTQVTDSFFLNNGNDGLWAREGAVISRCSATANGQSGIDVATFLEAGGTSTIVDCTATDNGATGISSRGVISRCSALRNGGDGIYGYPGSTITDCVANENASTGITVRTGQASGCFAHSNGLAGFMIYFFSRVSGCVAYDNGVGSTSDFAGGFVLNGRFARIEDCIAGSNVTGFRVPDLNTDSNFFARNIAADNTTNWVMPAGNICYVVLAANAAAINGNTGGESPGSTNPNANYTIT